MIRVLGFPIGIDDFFKNEVVLLLDSFLFDCNKTDDTFLVVSLRSFSVGIKVSQCIFLPKTEGMRTFGHY